MEVDLNVLLAFCNMALLVVVLFLLRKKRAVEQQYVKA